jgi:hypothetical protein
MDNFYSDERISSYLDGELSADEQARFEERLAESAELRQLVEELRALRGSLDLLPRYQLEPDFAERVLRRAEQQILIGGEGGSSGGASGSSAAGESGARSLAEADRGGQLAQPSHPVLDDLRRCQRRIVRPLIYAGAAIAAAILIMVFTPPGANEVVQRRPGEQSARRSDVASLSKSQRGASGFGVESNKISAQPNLAALPVENRPSAVAKDSKQLHGVSEKASLGDGRSLAAEGKGGPQAGRSITSADEKLAGTPAGGANNLSDNGSLRQQFREQSEIADQAENFRLGNGQAGNKPATGPGSDEGLRDNGRGATTPSIERYATNGSLAGGGQSGGNRHYGDDANFAGETDTLLRKWSDAAEPNMIVADYFVSPETANGAFRRLLIKHDIALHKASDGVPRMSSKLMDQISREAELGDESLVERSETATTYKAPTEKVPSDKSPLDRKAATDGGHTESLQLGMAAANTSPTDFEVVYVEGSPKQIQGLVSDLNADTTAFHSIALHSAPPTYLSVLPQAENPLTADALKDVQRHESLAEDNKPTGRVLNSEHSKNLKRESGGVAVGTGAGAAPGGALFGNGPPYQADTPAAPATADRGALNAKADEVPMEKSGVAKELHEIATKQKELEDGASKNGNLARTADKSAPADSNATVAKGQGAQSVTPPAPAAYGGLAVGSQAHKASAPFSAQTEPASGGYQKNDSNDLTKGETSLGAQSQTRLMSQTGAAGKKHAPPQERSFLEAPPVSPVLGTIPSAPGAAQAPTTAAASAAPPPSEPSVNENRRDNKGEREEQRSKSLEIDSPSKQADRGSGEPEQSYGYAFWFYRVPVEAKQGQSKEQLDGAKLEEKNVDDAPAPTAAAAGIAARPRSVPSAVFTPQSGPTAPAPPLPSEPSQTSPAKAAPTFRARVESADSRAQKPPNEAAQAAGTAEKPVVGKPAGEGPSAATQNRVKLRAETNGDQALTAAMPQRQLGPQDSERSSKRRESPPDAIADDSGVVSPRMQAIFIFRRAPLPAAAAPVPAARPAGGEKAKQ